MSADLFTGEIQGCVISALKNLGASTMAQLKIATSLHEVPVTIAIRNLQNAGIVEHGYVTPDGEWLDDYFPDEHLFLPVAAWRLVQ